MTLIISQGAVITVKQGRKSDLICIFYILQNVEKLSIYNKEEFFSLMVSYCMINYINKMTALTSLYTMRWTHYIKIITAFNQSPSFRPVNLLHIFYALQA